MQSAVLDAVSRFHANASKFTLLTVPWDGIDGRHQVVGTSASCAGSAADLAACSAHMPT